MTWLVTGGAGYIGSHVVRAFSEVGIEVAVIDDLSSGVRNFVGDRVPFYEGNLVDRALLERIVSEQTLVGIVHLAGFKYAGVSVSRPLHTYTQNVSALVTLLDVAAEAGIDNFVFSSSAAVYGTPETDVVTEESPTRPESPYGESKLIGEWLLADQAQAVGLQHTSLRYFNVVGSEHPDLRDTSPHNLFPLVFRELIGGNVPFINGNTYPTPDGTCIRDYVHVADLALAHVAAAGALADGRMLERVYNLGSGSGLSVGEIMTAVARVTGIDFTPQIKPPRPGDPARVVATGRLASRDLGWQMRHTVDDMVASAWQAARATA